MSTTNDEASRESRVAALRARLTQAGAILLRHESFESIPRGAEVWQLPGGGTASIPKPYLLDPPAALAQEVYLAALERAEAAAQ
jgi:hypothetical protein